MFNQVGGGYGDFVSDLSFARSFRNKLSPHGVGAVLVLLGSQLSPQPPSRTTGAGGPAGGEHQDPKPVSSAIVAEALLLAEIEMPASAPVSSTSGGLDRSYPRQNSAMPER
ncbi:hypothetical protein HQ447_08075 [bacterium]|nr:hypothetical protein [bacterium]